MVNIKRDFDKDAITWDENPARVKMAESVFKSITGSIKFSKNMDVLDFGCGTGLLSLLILPLVNSVTCADSSSGMLEVLKSKISTRNLTGAKTLYINADNGDKLPGIYDVVTSSMTMHHIKALTPLLKQFYESIKSGGYLSIADLDTDNGKFHDSNEGVFHEGFNRDVMKMLFRNAGFSEIVDYTATELSKPDKNGIINNFSVFLIVGRKI